jgi:hypothetical protein
MNYEPGVQHFTRRLRHRHLLRDHRQRHHPLRHPLQEEHADPPQLLHRQLGHFRLAPLLHDHASHSLGSFKVRNSTYYTIGQRCPTQSPLATCGEWSFKCGEWLCLIVFQNWDVLYKILMYII